MDKAAIGEMLRQLVAVDGLSGGEESATQLVQHLAGSFTSEAHVDALGSLILRKAGSASPPGRVMLAAHIDEIGLLVTKVEQGFLHIGSIGGVDPRVVIGQEVIVYPSGPGAEAYPQGLPGYVGARPPHVLAAADSERIIPLADLRVDLGLPEPFFERGIVRVGDRIAIRGPYQELLDGRVVSKSLDNRASVAAMLGTLGYLSEMKHTWDVMAVATVQEEIGLQGSRTSGYGVAPDLAVAIDVTFANTPGVDDKDTVPMDQGPAISWGPNLHPGVVKRLRDTAAGLEMSSVNEFIPGGTGTDAWALQVSRIGIPTALVSIPIRYMHSPVELAALADIDRVARLLAAFISRLDAEFLASLPEEV